MNKRRVAARRDDDRLTTGKRRIRKIYVYWLCGAEAGRRRRGEASDCDTDGGRDFPRVTYASGAASR